MYDNKKYFFVVTMEQLKDKRAKKSSFGGIIIILSIAFLIRTFGYGLYRVPTGSMETTMLVGELFFADKFSILFNKPTHGDIISFNDPLFTYSDNKAVAMFQSYVWGPTNWTKRVIGLPGDEIKGVIENGTTVLYRNGKKVDESYINTYPLIGVWKARPESLKNTIESDAIIEDLWAYKSYDPNKSYDRQPWYAIDAACIKCDEVGKPITRSNQNLWSTATSHDMMNGQQKFWNGTDEFNIKLSENQYWVMGDNRLNSYDSRSFGPLEARHIHGKIVFRIVSMDTQASWIILEMIQHPLKFWNSIRWNRCLQIVS
jgi:signal peptidase I